jgi:aconitate hydratase
MPTTLSTAALAGVETLQIGGDALACVSPQAAQPTLPYCLRVVLENLVRNRDFLMVSAADIARVGSWRPHSRAFSTPMRVSRVILPDSSGLPVLNDLAGLRAALARRGLAPQAAGPQIPVDLVVDHSLIAEQAGHAGAAAFNVAREFERNAERYSHLKWAQQAFDGLRVVPPGMGIVHQVHLERLARVVDTEVRDGVRWAFPEFVLGGDSHTPMVGALGVLAWGVGGIEAEAAILGQPHMVRIDRVIGVRLTGRLREGAVTTDLVLALTQRLREVGVVGQFVEFIGDGAAALTVPDRATLSNMAPEYGATIGFFPLDAGAIAYLRMTGREEGHIALVEAYARAAGLFRSPGDPEPLYSQVVELDVSAVEPSVAGPRRPQDRLALAAVKPGVAELLPRPAGEGGFAADPAFSTLVGGERIGHGALAIAAITSCTNTSNPGVMLGAGLLAKRAVELGLKPKPWVKASLAPGSRVVTRYLEQAGLLTYLEQLGFHLVGYGCTTCSGKSGPIHPEMERAVGEGLVAAAVLSGNRNFEGRIHRLVRAAYLASPLLVVAYALAGRVDIDITTEPLGEDADGRPVHLRDLWPASTEVAALLGLAADPALYLANYADLFQGTELWGRLPSQTGPLFSWDAGSTYMKEPPFFAAQEGARRDWSDRLDGARVLGLFGDSLTTDHIAPAGEIPLDSPAGRYLSAQGVPQGSFNAFTQRRGNHEVLLRGIFANPRIRNLLAPDVEGGATVHQPSGARGSTYDTAMAYKAEGVPAIVIAGKDYGMGSSRDWAAKGPALLGVRIVIAQSYERIHRANLTALGVLPLRFKAGDSWRSLGLSGTELFSFVGLEGALAGAPVQVTATPAEGLPIRFEAEAAIESPVEAACLKAGGMFATLYDSLTASAPVLKEPA